MAARHTRLYLHLGMPKTGTTFVQSVLHAGAEQVADQGLTMLPRTRKGSFRLSVAVRGGADADRNGADAVLNRFGDRLAKVGTPRVLTSDELLGGASSEQIARFLDVCGDAEVHVVVSVRSLSRLLPSTWQQRVQQRGESPPLEDFLATIAGGEGELAGRWWTERGVVPVLRRWAEHVPMERMHVITVPGAGADPRSLLERHGSVLGIDVAVLDQDVARPNVSLGWAQAEVLRRVKTRVPRALLTKQAYLPIGKQWLGAEHLAPQQGEPPRMPSSLRAWCEEEAASTIAWLAGRPLEVVGDLDDLRPQDEDFVADPRLDAEAVATAAIEALASIAIERTRERG